MAPGEEGAPCSRKSRDSGAARPARSHTQVRTENTRAGEQPETYHANPAEGVGMTMLSRVTADTDPLAQSIPAGPPSLEAGRREHKQLLPGPAGRAAAWRELVTEHTGLRHAQEPLGSGVSRATPAPLHQKVRGTRAAFLHGPGRAGRWGGLTSRGGCRGAPILPLLERAFARGERIWQRESPSLQGKRLALS